MFASVVFSLFFSPVDASPCHRAPTFTVFLYTLGRRISPSVMQHPIFFIIYTVVISRVQPLGCSNATSGINYEPRSTLTSQPEEMCLSLQCFSCVFDGGRILRLIVRAAHPLSSSQTMPSRWMSKRLQPAVCNDFQERACRKCSIFFSFRALSVFFYFLLLKQRHFAEFLKPRQVGFLVGKNSGKQHQQVRRRLS